MSKTALKNISPKKIIFRDYKKLDEQNVLYDLDQQMIHRKLYEKKICTKVLQILLKLL